MAVALILLFAQLSATPTEDDLARWIRQLDADDPGLRDHAARRLLEAGDDGADALEAAEFDAPEGALRAQELLTLLRQPTAILRPPPFIGRRQKKIVVELLISNPRPTPLEIEPLYLPRARGKGVRPNKRWSFQLPKGIARQQVARAQLTRRYEVPARSDYSIPLGFRDNIAGRDSFRIAVTYRGDSFRLHCRATIRVGKESLSMLRLRAYSSRAELRSEAVTYLRHRLRLGKLDPRFERTLRLVARSPYRDVRRGVARGLADNGRADDRAQIEILTMLAADRDLTVSRQAFKGLTRPGVTRNPPASLKRLASKLLARPGDGRARFLLDMLAVAVPRDRNRFLSKVLATNRSRDVHKAVAAMLRQAGVPVEPGLNGLIPRSQIERLGHWGSNR